MICQWRIISVPFETPPIRKRRSVLLKIRRYIKTYSLIHTSFFSPCPLLPPHHCLRHLSHALPGLLVDHLHQIHIRRKALPHFITHFLFLTHVPLPAPPVIDSDLLHSDLTGGIYTQGMILPIRDDHIGYRDLTVFRHRIAISPFYHFDGSFKDTISRKDRERIFPRLIHSPNRLCAAVFPLNPEVVCFLRQADLCLFAFAQLGQNMVIRCRIRNHFYRDLLFRSAAIHISGQCKVSFFCKNELFPFLIHPSFPPYGIQLFHWDS